MEKNMQIDNLMKFIEAEFCGKLNSFISISGGYHKTYKFSINNQYYFIKVAEFYYDKERFYKELDFANMIYSKNISFLIPHYINILDNNNQLILIESAVDGISLKEYFGKINCKHVAEQLFELHKKTRGNFSTWNAIVNEKWLQINEYLEILKNNMSNDFYQKICDKVRDSFKVIEKCNSVCMIHGDIGYGNIIVNPENGEIASFVDFEWAHYDDPIAEFVNIIYSAKDSNPERLDIINNYIEISKYNDFINRLDVYSFFHAIKRLALSIHDKVKYDKIIRDSYSVLEYLIFNNNILNWR